VTPRVAALLQAAEFRKRGPAFERRHGETTQLVELQTSRDGSVFYVNVGIVLDAITKLGPQSTGSRVIGKTPVHFGARLEELVKGVPSKWPTAAGAEEEDLLVALTQVLDRLGRIDGAATTLSELDLSRGFEKLLRAQLKWVTDDRDGARADVEAVAHEFSERRGCTVPELLARTGLG
jgi:hypothetical protein